MAKSWRKREKIGPKKEDFELKGQKTKILKHKWSFWDRKSLN